MQSWQGIPGQPAADGQQNPSVSSVEHDGASWQQSYAFPQGGEHFDPGQSWSQPVPGQPPFQHHLDTQGSADFFDAHPQHHQNGTFISGSIHNQQAPFQGSANSLNLAQSYRQPQSAEALDPVFENMHPDLYAQQRKMGVAHTQDQSQPHNQAFQQQDYEFAQPNDRPFSDSVSQQYTQPQLVHQQSHSHGHPPVQQQFEHAHPSQQQPLGFQNSQHPQSAQLQQTYSQNPAYQPSQANGHPQQQQQQQQQQLQQHFDYSLSQFTPAKSVQYQQEAIQGQHLPSLPLPQGSSGNAITSHIPEVSSQASTQQTDLPTGQSAPIDVLPKKRKRTLKSASASAGSDVISFQVDPHIDNSTSKLAEIDSLPPPLPTTEELDLLNKFSKRTKAAKAKFPAIKGLPHLVHGGTVTLPTPKSFDKLAPLVALPPRSGKRVVPELDYELPCQIQGRFSSQYQPSADKAGLEQRKLEAHALLDEYDKSMRAIGKRQPKYTEYPHAFKEQLKADEANKNKAGKKAKKDGEGSQRNKPIRADVRPTDPVEAAAWDAIGIVHIEPSVTRSSSLIATRVQQTGDFFIKLRGEMNHSKQDLDQATTDKAPATEIAAFAKEYDLKKQALYQSLDAVIEHADDAVLDNLGGHQKLISSLVNVLISCIKAGDFSGKLPKVALELFTQMPMTKKIAETTNFETVRKRFAEKGDDEAKDLAKEIAIKVKKALKPSDAESSGGYAGTSAANRAKVSASKPTDSSAAKRSRDEDGSDGRSVKKVIVEAGSSSLSKKLAPAKSAVPAVSKATVTKPAPSATLANKLRPVSKPITKTAEVPKPDTAPSSAEDKAKPEAKKPVSKPAVSSSSSALSGIGSLLASINTPKPEAPAAAKDVRALDSSETPEQRTKRLRKEARRKLRVSWKPEGELVKIKIFEKEDSEDEGRAHNMIKDAADDRSEGMVLKQRADMDEDDEDDDIPYQPWEEPTQGLWTSLPDETRNKNYVTRGGTVTFTTDEQERIREREKRELMVFYHDADDIPPSPKSPPPESAAFGEGTAVNLPSDAKFQEIHTRWKDQERMGPDGALYSAIRRLDAQQKPANKLDTILGRLHGAASSVAQGVQAQQPAPMIASTAPLVVGPAAEEQVLAWLTSEKTKNWQNPDPIPGELRVYHYSDPETRVVGTAIETLVRYLMSKPYPATSPPDWLLSDEERVREWWLGYNREAAARQKKVEDQRSRDQAETNAFNAAATTQGGQQASAQDWAAWLAQAQQQQQQQQQQQPQVQTQPDYMALLQQMAGGQAAQAAVQGQQMGNDQLQSILAAINQSGQQQQAQPQAAAFPQPTEDPVQRYLAQLAQGGQQQQYGSVPAVPPPSQQEQGRERDWDRDDDDDDDRDWDKDRDNGRGKRTRTLPPHKPINKALIGTKPCTFWQQGKCARGDQCTFRHD